MSYETPFAGLKVVDLSQGIAAPYAGMLLAQYGAEVLKVEVMGGGDWVRASAPEPGGNTFLSASAAYPALWIGSGLAAITTLASGNTWTPLAQGADAQGHYSAPTTPGVLDSTSTASGQNYSKAYGGTIRLAQNL